MTKHKIIIGDARVMKEIPDEKVHLIITSPPYWQLKDYGHSNQIGFNHSYEEYINNLNLVWKESHRVLYKGCRLCINIGDQFARSVYYGRYKVIPIRTEIIKFCETMGFDYMGAIIWQKVTTCNTTGGATIMGSFPYPRNGVLKIDYEFILIFKKYGNAPNAVTKPVKEQSKMTTEEWNKYFVGHWNFAGEKQNGHLAMFPEELPRRLIKMFSFVGDTVFDPFLGSGTTTLAARNLGRNSMGYEINKEFKPIIEEKLGIKQKEIFDNAKYEIIEQDKLNIDFNAEILKLPYVFKDPIKFDKKIDPKKIQFGSKIDSNKHEREQYYVVEEIINPELVKLNTGLKIRLIGIKQNPDKNGAATNFLQSKLKNEKVFIKFDKQKYDTDNNLMGYLYLKNKTFINAHLIKTGLVRIDKSYDYKYAKKFAEIGALNG